MGCNLDVLSQELFNLAKGNFNRSIYCKLGIYLIGIGAVCVKDEFSVFPILMAISVVASEIYQYRSDNFRRTAETLRRKLDFHGSFGWEVSSAEVSDILVRVPKSVEKKAEMPDNAGYFSSKMPPGPVKALENLEESSWYSKHLAETAFNYCILTVAVIIGLSSVALYAAINTHVADDDIPKISKIFTSTIMIIFSIGLIRLCLGYKRFKDRADRIEGIALGKVKAKEASDVDALKLWSEYHIARAGSPLIPEIVWITTKDKLNRLYSTHRNYR